MTLHRFFGSAVASSVVLVIACSSGSGGSGDGGSAVPAACDTSFEAVYSATNCAGAPVPSSEQARIKARYEQFCSSSLSLPGYGLTESAIDACSATLTSEGCGPWSLGTGACNFGGGKLATGAACATDEQCSSGNCLPPTAACGKCGPPQGTGADCSTARCSPGFACVQNGRNATCAALTYGGAGATCDGVQVLCKGALTCNLVMGTCVAPGGAGTACAGPSDCAPGLVCPGPNVPSRCVSPGKGGAPCGSDIDCAHGLGCDPNMQKCVQPKWAAAGHACDGTTRCLVGSCPSNNNGVGGTCPKVIPDGKPCNPTDASATCDTFSQCLGGKCHLGFAGVCP